MPGLNVLPFAKMNSLGNDFAVFRAHEPPSWNADERRLVGDRRYGIGCEQILWIEERKGDKDNVPFLHMWNQDGGEVKACGNGTRCAMAYWLEHQKPEENKSHEVTFQTLSGRVTGSVDRDAKRVTVTQGEARVGVIRERDGTFTPTPFLSLDLGDGKLAAGVPVDVGNVHWVLDDEHSQHAFETSAEVLSRHPSFPFGANVSIVTYTSKDPLEISCTVWEKGAGLTPACGTASCAIAAVALKEKPHGSVKIAMPGGHITVTKNAQGFSHCAPYHVCFFGLWPNIHSSAHNPLHEA